MRVSANRIRAAWLVAALILAPVVKGATALMENLGSGVVAIRTSATDVFVGWRILGTDPLDASFNLYRSTGGGAAVLLNGTPLEGPTHFTDASADLTQTNDYFVRPVFYGIEQAPSASFRLAANAPVQPYLRVPLQRPPDGTSPAGSHSYSPNDTNVGDLDGDGEYELVIKWEPSNARDSSNDGFTGNTIIDAYKLDGTRLWRIDLGINVRAGPHDTPFFAYDLDGDGRAEVFMRTSAGSRDGLGNFVADPAKFQGTFPAEPFDHNADYRGYPTNGRALVGPEFLTIFDGLTGAELASTKYLPARHPDTDFPTSQQLFDIWGDTFGNRQGRHYSPGVAYLDGQRPSIVMGRGYAGGQSGHPGRVELAAWNFRNGVITPLWQVATRGGSGGHTSVVADLDADGFDDIVYGQVWVRHDGTLVDRVDWGHGDALHVSQMDPDKPGQMVYMPHESPGSYGPNGLSVDDGPTGALVAGVQASGDLGRGVAADIDPRFRGYEFWGPGATPGLYNVQNVTPNAVLGPRAVQVAPTKPGSINHAVWWDGDLLRELLDNVSIRKWDWNAGAEVTTLAPAGILSINGTKSNPCLQADILGDWREEVIWRESNNDAIRIYTTAIPTTHRIHTLMHDRQYREAVNSQNVGYNQPPHPSFFLGDGMVAAPVPDIVTSLDVLLGPAAPVFTGITIDSGASTTDQVTNDQTLVLHGTAEPNSTVTVTRLGTGVIGATTANGAGVWNLDYTSVSLPEGFALFSAKATDSEGRTGAPTNPPFVVEIDLTPPGAPSIADVADEGGSLVFVGTGESNGFVSVVVDGGTILGTAAVDADGQWTLTYSGPPLSTGPHTFTATAADGAGNSGPASGGTPVNTSVTTPVITAITTDTGSSAADGVTSDPTLVFGGTAGPGDSVTLRRIGGAILGSTVADAGGAWSLDHTSTTLTDGLYAFSAAGTNANGTSLSSPSFLVTVDTVSPTVTSIVRQDPTAAVSTAPSITFRVMLNEPVDDVAEGSFTPVFGTGISGTISSVVSAGPSGFDVTLDLTGEGTVRLDVLAASAGISDSAGNALVADFTTGQTYTRALVGDGVWISSATSGLWSENANWLNGVVADNSGSTADFGTIEIGDDTIVHLNSPRSLGNLIFGDTDVASAASWIVDNNGNAANTLTLATIGGSPTIAVTPLGAGAVAELDVVVAGTQGFSKSGPGTLILSQANTLTGALGITAGTVVVPTDGTTNATSVNISSGGARLNLAGGTFTATGTLTVNAGSGSALIVDSGVGTFATLATNNSPGGLLRINGGTVTATGVTLPRSNDNNLNFGAGFVVAGGDVTVNGVVGLGTNNSNGVMSVEGGHLRVNGPVRVGDLGGNSGRGGIMRVINDGVLVVEDNPVAPATPEGIILVRRNNNTSVANFDGGLTTTNKLSIGAADVVTGNATVNVRGGALYLGGDGLVRAGTPTTTINLQSGILGAKADWATSVSLTLPAGGNIALKTADIADAPFDIALGGVISGAGGFTKTGAGRLTLAADNTFTGGVAVNAGTLEVSGSLAAGAALAVHATGLLSGEGVIHRAVTLNAGGTIMPGTEIAGSVLTVDSLAWNADGALAYDLDATSNQLAITGAFTKGGDGPHQFVFNAGDGIAAGNVYTLVTFGSTDFAPADLSFDTLAPGLTGAFFVNANDVSFKIYGPPIILQSPADAAVRIGDTATFAVSVAESPTLAYQWFKDAAPIIGATDASLTLSNVQGYDIGSYHVVVTNAAGSTASAAAALSIQALALVKRGPSLNSAEVFGSIQQMLGTNAALNGDMAVSGSLFAPGLPNVVLNGTPNYGGTLDGTGAATPAGYSVTVNSGTTLGHVVRRTDPVSLPTAAAPIAPTGTRSVTINNPSQNPGTWATLRNLTLNQSAGQIAVPSGAYGAFTVNGSSGFTFGIAGATTPSVYHFQSLTLNSGAKIQVVGPVLIVVSGSFSVGGAMLGDTAHPEWLTLNLHAGSFTLNSGTRIDGYVVAPVAQVTLNASSIIRGGLASNLLTMNSSGVLDLLGPPVAP